MKIFQTKGVCAVTASHATKLFYVTVLGRAVFQTTDRVKAFNIFNDITGSK